MFTCLLVYALRAVVLIPRDRIRRALQFEKDVVDAISNFERMESSTSEWELPFCLKNLAIEADCNHLLEVLDISVTQGKLEIWKEVIGILCRFKPVNEIGMTRISAFVEKFSFMEVQHLYVSQVGIPVNTTDAPVALVPSMHS